MVVLHNYEIIYSDINTECDRLTLALKIAIPHYYLHN